LKTGIRISLEAATKPQKKKTPIKVRKERQGVVKEFPEAEPKVDTDGDLRGPFIRKDMVARFERI
jgi:hypothetical protein